MRLAATLAAGLTIVAVPTPAGVTDQAWHLLAIFVATVVGIVLEPLPMGAVAVCAIAVATATGTLTINEALSGFGHRVIWLVLCAFFIARGFIKTGLGARIAYGFVRLLGRRTIGLGYSMVATDVVLAPVIPSNTARAGAVVFPIVRSVAEAYESRPHDGSPRRMGAFLVQCAFHGNLIASAMFLTAMAANPLAAQMAADQGIEITWSRWALAASVPGALSVLAVPWVLYRLYPPEVRETPGAAELARRKLAEMGPMSRGEWILLGTFVLLVGLWIFGKPLGLHSTVTALIGLAILLAADVLTWEDVVRERAAWNVFIWLSTLVMLASFLSKYGLITWFSQRVGSWFDGTSWLVAFVALTLIYFYSHYFFASNTAHVSGMYAAFLAVAVAAGAPPLLAALVLGFYSNLFSSMTHYGTGPAPVLFGAGYVPLGDWWRLGAVVSVVNLSIWYLAGGLWWRALGLW
ncbi:MAG: anion permease [Deltaproteobacteria bacterium]|nr:anion permease [Deltaproteobacteria bacterium]MBW2536531.1 anion permease [Deltaproteobacteria bacterium]